MTGTGSHPYWGQVDESNLTRHLDPQQPVYAVKPLNSMPYTGPIPQPCNTNSLPTEINPSSLLRSEPALVFLPHSTDRDWSGILSLTKHGVALSGSAARGKVGPILGSVDIAESDDSYLFRVSLPGVSRDEQEFRCDVEPSGKIAIHGVTATGEEKVYKHGMLFEMQTQNLCKAGEFLLSFQLPGPVDPQGLNALFGTNGIFEGVVKKGLPGTS